MKAFSTRIREKEGQATFATHNEPLDPYILHSHRLPDLIVSNLNLNLQLGIFGERRTGIKGKKEHDIDQL